MKNIVFVLSVVLIAISLMTSCSHKQEAATNLPEVSFTNDVLPVFQTGCAISGCHDQSTAKEGEVYTDYQSISRSIEPGNPDNSKAYKAMTNYFLMMPPEKPISVEDRTKIRVWILQGAKNN